MVKKRSKRMIEKRFTMSQNGNFHTVIDTVEKKPLGMFEFKENEFPVYACFHHIIDLLNELYEKNEQLKMENEELKLLVQNWEALDEEKDEQLDKQNQALKKLKKENEQLKQQLKTKVVVNRQYEELQKLKKENEQLKKQLESFKPIIFESDGKPVTLYKKGGCGMTEKRFCGQCKHFYNFYCPLRNIQVNYSGKTCPQFKEKWYK